MEGNLSTEIYGFWFKVGKWCKCGLCLIQMCIILLLVTFMKKEKDLENTLRGLK